MSELSAALLKSAALEPAQDFYRLRRDAVGFIEQLASRNWTDYNTHDPGITLLEALCYAITDLAYRGGWDIKDLLAPKTTPADPLQPFPTQAFFTARDILTVSPVTVDDFRRLLIDFEGVRNAWLLCKECACEASYLAWCEKDELRLRYEQPADAEAPAREAWAHGLYDALLELETDPEIGDLNDRKVEAQVVTHDSDGAHSTIMELRFPDVSSLDSELWSAFLGNDAAFTGGTVTAKLTRLGSSKTDNILTKGAAEQDAFVRNRWRNIFYGSFEIEIAPGQPQIVIENSALRLFFSDDGARKAASAADLILRLTDAGGGGFIQRYRKKAIKTREAVASAKAKLLATRNLDEDYCTIAVVGVEEVAVCADVEVEPGTDIELVQAKIWFAIEEYLNPPIPFHTLREMLDAGIAVEDIFNGPELNSGNIKADDLAAASLKSVLRASDIINRLMDIDGVIAVNRLLLTKYDSEGNEVAGAADPKWQHGAFGFDADRVNASWLLFIAARHQPRFYRNRSRFLFFKNGLPFKPRMDEAGDTLNQLRGDGERSKDLNADKDLKIPEGRFRNPDDYFPVQYSLPTVYGIGPEGLPSHASKARRAQAKQLKAYLFVFEQVLGNALAQLAHTADLFALDPKIARTYFVKTLSEKVIRGFDDIASTGTSAVAVKEAGETLAAFYERALLAMTETPQEFLDRRNVFLDHLLARFGEQFDEYALLLSNAAGKQAAQKRLIEDKISFLNGFRDISHDRDKAFDYSQPARTQTNQPGIKKRISLLLGFPDLIFTPTAGTVSGGNQALTFVLADRNGSRWLEGGLSVAAASAGEAERAAYRAVVERMVLAAAYKIVPESGRFRLKLTDEASAVLGQHPSLFDSKAEAVAMQNELLAWSANERLIVVEHLLLRPKFPGDALFPACSEGACVPCGEEDPYSFRLTFVMPGWTAQYTNNLDLRRFADRTIQQETPAHLLGKTCWAGNHGFIEDPCDEIIGRLAELLLTKGLTAGNLAPGEEDACACANTLYHLFSTAFKKWYAGKELLFIHKDALETQIAKAFDAAVKAADVHCTTVFTAGLWHDVQAVITGHFVEIALYGWQFERFEAAWHAWLEVNSQFAWGEERLLERVQAILESNPITTNVPRPVLCQRAKTILSTYGEDFFSWMEGNLLAGKTLEQFSAFAPRPISLDQGMEFTANTAKAIGDFLAKRYRNYKEVSYRLWIVVNLLSKLRNTYPGATLHDCDDGSDRNPVRLGNTALGNYRLRTTLI